MAEHRDLCSDGGVARMWVWILAGTVVLVSMCKTLYRNFFCSPRSINGYLAIAGEVTCNRLPSQQGGMEIFSFVSCQQNWRQTMVWWANMARVRLYLHVVFTKYSYMYYYNTTLYLICMTIKLDHKVTGTASMYTHLGDKQNLLN